MKRLICAALLICLLLPICLAGCANDYGSGSEVCLRFIELLYEGDYASAYELIDTDTKNLTGEATTRGAAMISYTEFEAKYKNIFEAIKLTDMSYVIKNTIDGQTAASVDYSASFVTDMVGTLNYDYTLNAQYKNERWNIMWTPAHIFPMMEWGDNILSGVNHPSRGEIFDAEGELLATNMAPFTVYCTPTKIAAEDKEAFIEEVLAIQGLDLIGLEEADEERYLRDFANRTNPTVVIAIMYPDEVDDALRERILAVKGLGIDTNGALTSTVLRYYPYGNTLSHILGFASVIQKEDLKTFEEEGNEFYDGDSWLGYAGLELEYEELLRGSKGAYAYIQGMDGTNRLTLYNIPAVDGQDLHLSVSVSLQQRVEDVVTTIDFDDNVTGTVIVMNPKTGEVQAMYSWPDYDPNDFSRGNYTDEQWTAMEHDPQTPLLNRAIQGLYPPGSTFKTITAAALLETDTFTIDTLFPESSETVKWDVWYPSAGGEFAYTGITQVTRTRNTNRHTPMNMSSSIIDSDNLYFAYGALKMGWEVFTKYLAGIGMTESIPFDELGTQPAQIYNAATEVNTGTAMDYFKLAASGYGQGEILITPLQLASYLSCFANDGNVMVPYIVDSIWQASGVDYKMVEEHEVSIWKTVCSKWTADTIASMMADVCKPAEEHGGTGKYLRVFSYKCAGKTGTAEIGKSLGENSSDKEKELAWFIAYRYTNKDGTPVADEDQRLVLVMLEISPESVSTNYADTKSEYALMKFLIMQELLKDDGLTEKPYTEDIMNEG